MLTSSLCSNYGCQQEKQKRRDDSKPSKAGSNSEVILILGEPTPGDLSTILRLGANPSRRSRQRRLLIFTSDIRGLPQSALDIHYVDIHTLSNRLGLNLQASGEAIHLVGLLERASRFAAAWRADAERFIRDDQLAKRHSTFSSHHDSAHSSRLPEGTHAIDSPEMIHSTCTTLTTLNGVNHNIDSKLRSPRDYPDAQSNSNSKSNTNRITVPASKGLLTKILSLGPPSVPRPDSPPISYPQNLHCSQTHSQLHPPLATYARTFDTILNLLSPELTEKSLLKQVILLTTLCGQYFGRSRLEIPLSHSRAFDSPISSANPSRSPSPSSSGILYPQNIKGRASALFFRTPRTEYKVGEVRRISTASSGSSSATGSATPARSSRSTNLFDTQQSGASSTTSTSQVSDAESGANSKVDVSAGLNTQWKPIELRRRLTLLFGRTPKRPQSTLNPTPQAQQRDIKRRTKIVQQISHKHAYLIHILPTSPPGPSSAFDNQNEILDEPELVEKRQVSLPSPSPLSESLNGLSETATGSFNQARMQTSLMRRATLRQMRLRNRYSMPAASVERGAPRVPTPMSRHGSLPGNPVQVQKREKPLLSDQLEKFLDDYFRQGNGEVLPFILDGVFGREVGVKMGKSGSKKRMLVGEAVLSGLLDEFAMNRHYWVGDEDLGGLVDHLNAGDDEEIEGSVEETAKSLLMGPKHPPTAAISSSSSEGSEGAGTAGAPSSQGSRNRAISDTEPAVMITKRTVISLHRAAMKTLKAPEPAHIHPPSRPPAILPSLTRTPVTAPIPAANGGLTQKLLGLKRLARE